MRSRTLKDRRLLGTLGDGASNDGADFSDSRRPGIVCARGSGREAVAGGGSGAPRGDPGQSPARNTPE